MLAFTTRIPLAVMIAMGMKQYENRASLILHLGNAP